MKKALVQIKIGLLLILAVIILSATSYLSYRNLSSIVSSLHTGLIPELRLFSIREVTNELERADNSIRIYTITRDTGYLKTYYSVISGIDEKVNNLRTECRDNPVLLEQIDTISKQIEESIIVWNQLLFLAHNNKATENLRLLSDSINYASEKNQKKEVGILKRVFGRRVKNPASEQDIAASLKNIEQQDSIAREKIRDRETHLAGISSAITKRFYDLIAKMENEAALLLKERAIAAGKLAEDTYRWLIIFSVSGGALALLVLFIIVRYIRKTVAYQTALEKSNAEAEKLARTKEMFMANMSHEIRTPVTAISGFTEQLLHESHNEEIARILRIIKSSSDHLARIINDILDFSKLHNNKLALEKVPFSIGHILEEVHSIFELQAKSNNDRLSYSLDPETPPVLIGDPYRLKQILINLVSNAVKFTRDGEVNFTANCLKTQSGKAELILQVVDTGIGIDEAEIGNIFNDFAQEEMSTSRKYGGTGLGLSIVKKLVELYQGTIECKSRKNYGTTITCRIPVTVGDEKQLKRESAAPVTDAGSLRDLRFLIVDDEEYNRLLFKKILDRWMVRYDEASNGLEAIGKLKEQRYDLLFMDIRMPEFDGIKAARYIREEMKITDKDMPVVLVSAATENGFRQEYADAGANAFIQKPFTEEMLLSVILEVNSKRARNIPDGSGTDGAEKSDSPSKINLHNLYRISGGDDQFVKQMLISFIQTTKKGLEDLNEAVLTGQSDRVSSLAHKLLAPCRHLGAMELCSLLQILEKDAGTVKNEAIETLARESMKEFEVVSAIINDRIAKIA
jgi:signal transduction histidine kinase/HPt (histidine-containing phosphotransfer) domain-containing protein/ActR/RegA family two-component response regulator